MKLSIRKAKIKDSESIAKLCDQLGYKDYGDLIQLRLSEILKKNDNCVFVALANENLVGWIQGFYTRRIQSDPFVEIGGLVVDESYRKNGIGKMLVKRINKWAESKECKKVRVRCNTLRKETHIFYEKVGFKMNKEQKVLDEQLK